MDQVSIKVASHHLNGGEVLVMLTSDETKKTISHMEGKNHTCVGNKNSVIQILLDLQHLVFCHFDGTLPVENQRYIVYERGNGSK